MRKNRLYMPDLSTGPRELPSEEADHLRRVLRGKVGDRVILFDGRGREADGTIARVSRDCVTVDVGEVVMRPFDFPTRITLATALPRAPRQTMLFEKCTELGAWAVWPMVCNRSVVRPRESSVAKWRRSVIEASKQCGRTWATKVEPAQPFDDIIASAGEFDLVVQCHAQGDAVSLATLLRDAPPPRSVLAMIGPEGGWTDDETVAAARVGAVPVTLGLHVLRIETAAITAVALLAALAASSPRTP